MDLLTPADKWAARPQESTDETPPDEAFVPRRMPWPQSITMFLSVFGPIAGLIAAIVLLWHRGPHSVGWTQIIVMFVMYAIAGFGTTIGYHRLLTHKAFETYRWVRLLFAIFGSIGAQGAPIRWTATHRRHHQTSDREGDPHSPHTHGDTSLGLLQGLWHAQMGWLFYSDAPDSREEVPDLCADPAMLLIDRLYFFWVAIGILIPGVIVWLADRTAAGFLSGMIWGGLMRVCLMQHVTWSINSVCHVWGTRPFRTPDQSVNNFVCAIFALGEGWHNNHHAFPTSARQGLRWWQFDSSWLIIQLMGLTGLAWNIRTPSANAIQAKLSVTPAA